jgi:hypothetical protein
MAPAASKENRKTVAGKPSAVAVKTSAKKKGMRQLGITQALIKQKNVEQVSSDDETIIASTPAVLSSYVCDICAAVFKPHQCTNIGCRKYPNYRCKPCKNSVVCLDRANKTHSPKSRAHLLHMKKHKRESYCLLIRKFRIALPDESPAKDTNKDEVDIECVSTIEERQVSVQQFIENVESYLNVFAEKSIAYFTRRQFIAHYVTTELMKRKDAKLKWERDSKDSFISAKAIRDEDDALCLPVRMPLYVKKQQGQLKKRKLESSIEVGQDEEDVAVARKKLKFTPLESIGATFLADVTDELFEPKNACRADIDMDDIEVDEPQEDDDLGSLAKLLQLPDAKLFTLLNGNTDLVKARTEIKGYCARVLAKFHDTKECNFKKLGELVMKLGGEHEDVVTLGVAQTLSYFNSNIDSIKKVASGCSKWTEGTFKCRYEEARTLLQSIVAAEKQFVKDIESLKGSRRNQIADSLGNRRRIMTTCRMAIGNQSLVKQGFPKSLMGWFAEEVCCVSPENLTLQPKDSFAFETDGPDMTNAIKFASDAELGKQIDALLITFVTPLEKAQKKVDAFLVASDEDHLAHVRLSNGKSDKGLVHELDGPSLSSDGKYVVTLAGSKGLVLLSSRFCGFRSGQAQFNFGTIGGFLKLITGKAIIFLVPAAAVIEAGGALDDVLSMLSGTTPEDAVKFMRENCTFMSVEAPPIVVVNNLPQEYYVSIYIYIYILI